LAVKGIASVPTDQEHIMANDEITFETPQHALARPENLIGATYKIKAPNGRNETINIYLTVNEHDGRPFEVFLNCSDSSINELLGVSMVLISRLLRLSVPLEQIASDLEQVASLNTGHFADKSWCPSLIARIGRVLKTHEGRRQARLELVPTGDEHA
jgi:hypothetical protein